MACTRAGTLASPMQLGHADEGRPAARRRRARRGRPRRPRSWPGGAAGGLQRDRVADLLRGGQGLVHAVDQGAARPRAREASSSRRRPGGRQLGRPWCSPAATASARLTPRRATESGRHRPAAPRLRQPAGVAGDPAERHTRRPRGTRTRARARGRRAQPRGWGPKKLATTVWSAPCGRPRRRGPARSARAPGRGVQHHEHASTPSSTSSACIARRSRRGAGLEARSSGLPRRASLPAARRPARASSVARGRPASSPAARQASAARSPRPPEVDDSTATRPARGSGWSGQHPGHVEQLSRVSTRITPVWRAARRTRVAAPRRAVVGPARAGPLCTATIGLARESRRAMRLKFRGLPKRLEVEEDHVGAVVLLPVLEQVVGGTSALLPAATKVDMPRPARPSSSSTAAPMVPDSDSSAAAPGRHGRR